MKNLGAFLPLILIALLFYVLVIRPGRKRQQDVAATQRGVTAGSRVMLTSGIFGTVVSLADETITLEVSPGTQLTVARQAVMRIVEPGPEPVGADGSEDGLGDGRTDGPTDGGPSTTGSPTDQD